MSLTNNVKISLLGTESCFGGGNIYMKCTRSSFLFARTQSKDKNRKRADKKMTELYLVDAVDFILLVIIISSHVN